MSWTHQVWHVFRKDVMRQRWLLLSLVLCTFGSMAIMLQRSAVQEDYHLFSLYIGSLPLILWMLLPTFAALLAATTIVEDAPTEPRAHWATLPVERSAVISAKLLLVLGVVPLIVCIALAVMHLSFGVRLHALPVMLLTGVRTLIVLISIALPIAAIVRDLRGFLLAALALFALALLLLEIIPRPYLPLAFFSPMQRLVITLLLVVGAAGLAWRLYVTRRTSWRMYAAVGALGLLNAANIVVSSSRGERSLSGSFPDAHMTSVVRRISNDTTGKRSFEWQLRLNGLPRDVHVVLRAMDATVVGDASCEPLIGLNGHATVLQYPALPVGESIRWLGTPPDFTRSVDTAFTQRWMPAGDAPACLPTVHAVLDVSSPRLLGRIPLEGGASLTNDGYQLSVRAAGLDKGGWIARLEVASSVSAPPLNRPTPADLVYVLLHASRSEAMLLETGTQSGFGERPISRSLMVLFPARPRVAADGDTVPRYFRMVRGSAEWLRETSQRLGFASSDDADRWLRGAELLVFTWDARATIAVNPEVTEDVR